MKFNRVRLSSMWSIILLSLMIAAMTWWWFERRINSIDDQIENLNK